MEQEILARLDALAEKLGVAAEQLWEIVIVQTAVEGGIAIVWVAVSIAVLSTCCVAIARVIQREKGESYWDGSSSVYVTIAICLGIMSAIATIVNTNIAVTRLLNPEFYALRYIIEAL